MIKLPVYLAKQSLNAGICAFKSSFVVSRPLSRIHISWRESISTLNISANRCIFIGSSFRIARTNSWTATSSCFLPQILMQIQVASSISSSKLSFKAVSALRINSSYFCPLSVRMVRRCRLWPAWNVHGQLCLLSGNTLQFRIPSSIIVFWLLGHAARFKIWKALSHKITEAAIRSLRIRMAVSTDCRCFGSADICSNMSKTMESFFSWSRKMHPITSLMTSLYRSVGSPVGIQIKTKSSSSASSISLWSTSGIKTPT